MTRTITPIRIVSIGVGIATATVLAGGLVPAWAQNTGQQDRAGKAPSSRASNGPASAAGAACPEANTRELDIETDPPLAEETVLRAVYGGTYRDGHLFWTPAERGSWPWKKGQWKSGELLATDVVASLSMRSSAGDRQYVLLTSTKPESWVGDIPGHPAAPVLGTAVFTRTEGNWVISSCQRAHERMGSWGDLPEPDTVVLGPAERHTGFLLKPGYTAQGITTQSQVIYAVVGGSVNKVLEINDAYRNGGYGNEKVNYSTELEMVRDGSDGFYDIIARKEGTEAERVPSGEEPEWEVDPVSEVTRYTFKDGAYQEVE